MTFNARIDSALERPQKAHANQFRHFPSRLPHHRARVLLHGWEVAFGFVMSELIGKTYGQWTVVSWSHRDRHNSYFNCQCACGTKKIVRRGHLVGGETESCGCSKHGLSRTRTYLIWAGMKQRCSNPNNAAYYRYGGRGIRVCERWINSFEEFLNDMGECPDGLTIERKNNDGNYEPGNCRWATEMEQASNTSRSNHITHNGETHHASEWARILNIPVGTLNGRVFRGCSVDRILSQSKFINQWK